jgi:hypothetical protein
MKNYPKIGFIAEGITDFAVLENILVGLFEDNDITSFITELQPEKDKTDEIYQQGGWTRVLSYCKSMRFKEAFTSLDYIIVQIDTDRLFEPPFELDLRLPVDTLIKEVETKFQEEITMALGQDFWDSFHSKIIFAVSVDAIECWLLPLFFPFKRDKNAEKIKNCLDLINKQLKKDKKQPLRKDKREYEKASLDFCKPKVLLEASQKNPSFIYFIEKNLVVLRNQRTEKNIKK